MFYYEMKVFPDIFSCTGYRNREVNSKDITESNRQALAYMASHMLIKHVENISQTSVTGYHVNYVKNDF